MYRYLNLLLVAVSISCTAVADGAAKDERQLARSVVTAVWEWHWSPVARVTTTDDPVDLSRLQSAITFFERLTGIECESGSDVGKIPGPALLKARDAWAAWLARHRDEVTVNPDACGLHWQRAPH